MRKVLKLKEPSVLAQNEVVWLTEYLADKTDTVKRYRYRHSDIKSTLKEETADKCVYCESKIGHNTPGDVEHKVPTSKAPQLHFTWDNLTIACTECNRRKGAFYQEHDGFLDPYVDNVDDFLEHHGPIVAWKTGSVRGEVFVRQLEFLSPSRFQLVAQKISKFNDLVNVLERYDSSQGVLKELLARQLTDMASPSSEYSSMTVSALRQKNYGNLVP